MKGVFLTMRIYQPVRGVGGALRENSFVVIDDAGVEIGQGGLEYRVIKKMMPDRPLDIEMTMNAHPVASDTLFGALSARAERIKDEEGGLPARLYTRCAIDDAERHEYFTRMGFDDFDGVELFVLNVEHASEWLEERMRGPVFMAKAMYFGSDYVGSMLVTGTQAEAVLEMICVEQKWRGRGVASALVDEALVQLSKQQVPHIVARAVRRNASAMKFFKRSGFDWVRTEEYLLGRDM